MEITEEQRKRAEANRLAALSRRNQAMAMDDAWRLFKCRKILNEKLDVKAMPGKNPDCFIKAVPEKNPDCFRVMLEICSVDEFSVTPEPVSGSTFPRKIEFCRTLDACLSSVVPLRYVETQSGARAAVYKLKDYDMVIKCLKKFSRIQVQEIPWKTLAVIQKFSYSVVGGKWIPCMPNHLSDAEVDCLLEKLPKMLRYALLPFQLDGVKFGLRRGGRCLIADEMGLGKTIQLRLVVSDGDLVSLISQAIATACCFMNEGPILVVCPAILRFSWAEELERWLPFCLPIDIHLVFGHQNNLVYLTKCPKVVVISYTMLHRLRKSMLEQEWALMIVDESHNIRCTKKASESEETKAVLDMATKVSRIILLSGTPSLSRPGLLGNDKYEFARNYCSVKVIQGPQGKTYKDFSKGIRLEELNVLLRQTIMTRRLKEHVLVQLPKKRRQVVRVMLKGRDIMLARAACGMGNMICTDTHEWGSVICRCAGENDANEDGTYDGLDEFIDTNGYDRTSRQLSYQEIGIAKLSAFREWLSNHSVILESEGVSNSDIGSPSQKMLIFGHHLKVLDGIQGIACEIGIEFVRIDGSTLPRDRQAAVHAFRLTNKVKIAIIGITAGGVGLDFSSAQNVVFLELPKSASEMLQAEDRAHRRGQSSAVNIYIFCAKDTSDESHWRYLNKSLYRVSSMMNGKDYAVQEIQQCWAGVLSIRRNPGRSSLNSMLSTKRPYLLEVDRVYDLDLVWDVAQSATERGNDPKDVKSSGLGPDVISKFHADTNKNELVNAKIGDGISAEMHTETPKKREGGAGEPINYDANGPIATKAACFEVDKDDNSANAVDNATDDIKLGNTSLVSTHKFTKGCIQNDLLDNRVPDEIFSSNEEPIKSETFLVRMEGHVMQIQASEPDEVSANVEIDVNSSVLKSTLCTEFDKVNDIDSLGNCAQSGCARENSSQDMKASSSGLVSSGGLEKGSEENNLLDNTLCHEISLSKEQENPQNILVNQRMCSKASENGEANEQIEADANSSIPPGSLRFEVSQHTGRIHLYACIPGRDARPRPLCQNFRPEELESQILSTINIEKEAAPKLILGNPAYQNILREFVKAWNNLRPIERNKLLGKPLQLPLDLELCYLKETANHGCGGLLKGGSKRRVTPMDDISYPLPENAVWKKVSLCGGNGKKDREYTQAWTTAEEPLCKLCQKSCSGKLAKAPEFFEDLFCDLSCFEEYRLRTSQRSLREALFHIEHGVCTRCKLDCHKLVECIRPLPVAGRQEYIEKVAPKVASQKSLIDKLVHEPIEGNAWHADHIIPVYKGGGECRLENMRTLCVACHSEVTAAQRAERQLTRMRAKEQLKVIMKEIRVRGAVQADSELMRGSSEAKERDILEDDLLVEVPGSAYSTGKNVTKEDKSTVILLPENQKMKEVDKNE